MARRMRFENLPIRYKLLVAHLILLIGAALVGSVILYAVVRRTIETNIETELSNSTAAIFRMVHTTVSVAIRNHLRGVAEKNREVAAHFWGRHLNGELSRAEAVARIREVFLSQRIGQTGYLYCIDSRGVAVLHPRGPVEGVDWSDRGFIQQQIARRNGYMEYMWRNPGEREERPKALYMTYFAPLDWIISVSAYREEFRYLVDVDDFRDYMLGLRFGDSGYAYLMDTAGNVIVHPSLEGANMLTSGGVNTGFVRRMIEQRNGKLDYEWRNPGEGEARRKLVTFDYLPEMDWIVATSSYHDEIYDPLVTARHLIAGTVAAALLLVVPLTFWIGRRITDPLQSLMQRIDAAARGDYKPAAGPPVDDETGRLSRYFDDFMRRIGQSQAELGAEIAERQQAVRALRERETELRALLDNMPDMAWLKDVDGRFRIANRNFAQFWRVAPDAVKGRTDADLGIDPELVEKFRRSDDLVVAEGAARRFEAPLVAPGGGERWYETLKSPIFDERRAVVGILGISRDVTERKQTERQMLQVQKMEAVGTLAGGIAHDFNNLLGGVLGNVNLIQMTLPPEDPIQEKLKTIEKVVISGSHLARQLLGFARGGKYEARATDPNRTVTETLELFARTRKRIRIHTRLEEKAWTVHCDQTQIEQVLLNLWVNAADAMPDGGELFIETENTGIDEAKAAIHGVKPGPFVTIRIRDTGHGMPPDVQARVFEPFYTTKEIGKGTGLGLASAYGIVENHGGFIELDSTVGRGTEFRVRLPADDHRPQVPIPVAGTSPPNHAGTVLLVDDEPMFLDVSEEMLGVLGYEVIRAENGPAALARYEEHRGGVDLVILDIIMPGMDGMETFARLRALDPSVKVLMASGYSKDSEVARILEKGAGGFIEKPFRLHELARKINTVLQAGSAPQGPQANSPQTGADER